METFIELDLIYSTLRQEPGYHRDLVHKCTERLVSQGRFSCKTHIAYEYQYVPAGRAATWVQILA